MPASRRWLSAIAAAGVLGVVVIAGISGRNKEGDGASSTTSLAGSGVVGDGSTGGLGGTGGNPGAVDGDLTVPVATVDGVVVASTDAPVHKTSFAQTVTKGSFGNDVKQLQQRLTDLHFAPGPVDGQLGAGTQQAVWAYKKLVTGMTWQELDASNSATSVTPEMWQQMQDPILIRPLRSGSGTHVEIYLPKQVLIVFTDDQPTLITHIASGNDATWCELLEYDTDEFGQPLEQKRLSDECGVSHTPGGVFKFYRRYEGNRVGALGGMFNPVYFNYGIAVHGAREIPTHPASHGCIRVNMDIAEYFPSLVKNGNRVYVWGEDGREPESYTKNEKQPPFNYKNPDSTTTTSSSTTTSSTSTTVLATSTTAPSETTTATTTKPTATTTPTGTTNAAPVTTVAPPTTAAPTASAPTTSSPQGP